MSAIIKQMSCYSSAALILFKHRIIQMKMLTSSCCGVGGGGSASGVAVMPWLALPFNVPNLLASTMPCCQYAIDMDHVLNNNCVKKEREREREKKRSEWVMSSGLY